MRYLRSLPAVMLASGGSLWLLPPFVGMLVSACREVRGFFPEKELVL